MYNHLQRVNYCKIQKNYVFRTDIKRFSFVIKFMSSTRAKINVVFRGFFSFIFSLCDLNSFSCSEKSAFWFVILPSWVNFDVLVMSRLFGTRMVVWGWSEFQKKKWFQWSRISFCWSQQGSKVTCELTFNWLTLKC